MVGPERPQFVLFGSSIVQFSFSNGGWGASLADLYARKADIILRGYSGWNSRCALQVLEKVFPKILADQQCVRMGLHASSKVHDKYKQMSHEKLIVFLRSYLMIIKDAATQPSLVIVYFGGNDSMRPHPSGLGPHVPLPEYIENMRKIAIYLESLSDCTRLIFLTAPPINEEKIREFLSDKFQDLGRTNDACRVYSEACLKLCREMNIKAVDLWTAIQKRDDWATACFTDGIHFSSEGSEIVEEEILRVLKEADWEPSLCWESMPTEFGEDSPHYPLGPDGRTTVNLSDSNFHRSNKL